jgi:Protein of unknown function (DUF3179)
MRTLSALLLVTTFALADNPKIIVKPDAFETLVNPNCSHCVDEAKRRKDELKDADPVLMWTRGKYDGGAIPIRFFLNSYRVISDTYGVFVYDPDAGYARGFKASVDFRFHGWRNGVMVMKHKDGTLFSCLTGIAFDGPRKGAQLESWPTIVSNWGWVMKHYPDTVAYHMFEKYKPSELTSSANADSVGSRGIVDNRLPAEELVLGVNLGGRALPRAYRLADLDRVSKTAALTDTFECGNKAVILWDGSTKTAAAYHPMAHRRAATKELSKEGESLEQRSELEIVADGKSDTAPFVEKKSGTRFDVAGRGVDGELKGWVLTPVADSLMVKWFAWSAEYPRSTVYAAKEPPLAAKPIANDVIKEVAGTAEFLRAIPKKFATVQGTDAKTRTVTLLIDGEATAKTWPLTPDAEVKVAGWWGRVEQLPKGTRVWAWFHSDRKKNPTSVFMLADEASEKDIHGAKEEKEREVKRQAQRAWLRDRWVADGLPGTVAFVHLSGEVDLMLDHEAMRWGRSLTVGDKVRLSAAPPVNAVVKDVRPWRERTQVRLVVNGLDIAELNSGQRTLMKMPAPSKEIEDGDYPPDIGRKRSKEERVEWFLASMYCICSVGGDICTGDFYTLASCNPNGCGAPNQTRKRIAALIDKGMDDKQIYDNLKAERGPLMTRPHLLP